jgi:glycosyltransferase involved in cell wall biosynthesis
VTLSRLVRWAARNNWLPVVSSAPRRRPPPRPRILALLAVRDDVDYLPGCLESVGPQVDGIVALDDGSTDGSAELLASSPEVVELIRIPPDRPTWDEAGNHRRLVEAALRAGGDWAVCVDADERVEREFRVRLERVIARGRPFGFRAYQVRLRELWGSPDRFRVDGIWGQKTRARIFRLVPGAQVDATPLHGLKVPVGSSGYHRCPLADLELYHLRMITPEARAARRARYEAADPEARWQAIGYAYLTDDTDLELRAVDPARGYDGLPRPATSTVTPPAT